MDVEFARTFLAVAAAGNFVRAAQRLHVTQSTVSARIQALENQLGATLFRRGRSDAKTMVQTLEQAKHDVGLPMGFRGSLTLSGRLALWDGFLPQWVERMRGTYPDISLWVEAGFEEGIMHGLVQGMVDIGVMYTPESRPGLGIERLFEEVLVLVSTEPSTPWPYKGYIHMDWGPEFHAQFTTSFPDLAPAAITVNIGWLMMQQILHCGGSGYFPLRIARELIDQGHLWRVQDSPSFSLPAYMVFPVDRQDDMLASALDSLRALGAEERAASRENLM
jgi:DNA-binding transcriptional LysR family regulator